MPPEDCLQDYNDFRTPTVQIEKLCPHCFDVVEESREPLLLKDKNLSQKIFELEEILKMACYGEIF